MSRRKPPTPDSLVSRRALARLLRPASIAVIAACVLVPAIPAAAARGDGRPVTVAERDRRAGRRRDAR
ncbi:hypothetical protein [Microbacterium sp. Se63.02b]|uniref:hypothetical protein n=1 Tax=Microbacterium sp. Se63.02b TaxID=2709304 RepID=UPI0016053527|nr:hypothetical protein [Microbacterium sp. Se63.02b]QNA93180.1 hypothetical protein G4G29_14245 [Microbacterium sp. Se63.02b]